MKTLVQKYGRYGASMDIAERSGSISGNHYAKTAGPDVSMTVAAFDNDADVSSQTYSGGTSDVQS